MKGGLCMKFYSKRNTKGKPNTVVEEVKNGLNIVSQKQLCVFINGECEVEDPGVIQKLLAKPNQFRASPWTIDTHGTGDCICEEKICEECKIDYSSLKYNELLAKAKEAGIKTKKKEEIIKSLQEKEVMLNG